MVDWWLLAVVITVTLFQNDSGIVSDKPFSSFEKMVRSNDVKQVVLVKNQDFIEVTLKEEALSNTKYKLELDQNKGFLSTDTGPHYKFQVVSVEKFAKDFEELKNDLPEDQQFDYKIEERSDYTSILFNWGFLILLIFGFWFLMRR